MDGNPSEEGKKHALKLTLEAISRARKLLSEALQDERKIRNIDLIWRIYLDVEFSIGLGRFLVKSSNKNIGRYRKLVVSKKNDPLLMPLDQLKEKIKAIDVELDYLEHDFETARSERGLESGRKARDELKMLILAGGKKVSERISGKKK